MREIKFRAWNEGNKVMHNDVEFIRSGTDTNDWIIFKSDKQTLQNGEVFDNPYFAQQLKLMQYTGLKDKNGVEVYDNDIVRILQYEYNEETHLREDIITKVEFIDYSYCFTRKLEGANIIVPFSLVDFRLCEVIGNIYENKELLK